MAAPNRTPRTSFGTDRAGNLGTGITLFDSATGTEYVLWVQSGDVMIGTPAQYTAQAGGTVVGGQS